VRFFRKKPTFAAKFFIVFTPLIRFTLLILCTIVGIISALSGWNYLIIIAALLSVSLLWGYYNVGTVYLALHKLRKGKYEESEQILDLTRKPEKLNKTRRAYYYYIKAYVARERDDFEMSKQFFHLALEQGLKTEHDQAIALLALADISVIQGDKEKARAYLGRMRGLKVQPQLMPQIRQMQEYLGEIFV